MGDMVCISRPLSLFRQTFPGTKFRVDQRRSPSQLLVLPMYEAELMNWKRLHGWQFGVLTSVLSQFSRNGELSFV